LIDIPTIPMNEADGDDAIDMSPQMAVAPEFSVHQITSFKEMEKEFSRERTSQYIVRKTYFIHNFRYLFSFNRIRKLILVFYIIIFI